MLAGRDAASSYSPRHTSTAHQLLQRNYLLASCCYHCLLASSDATAACPLAPCLSLHVSRRADSSCSPTSNANEPRCTATATAAAPTAQRRRALHAKLLLRYTAQAGSQANCLGLLVSCRAAPACPPAAATPQHARQRPAPAREATACSPSACSAPEHRLTPSPHAGYFFGSPRSAGTHWSHTTPRTRPSWSQHRSNC